MEESVGVIAETVYDTGTYGIYCCLELIDEINRRLLLGESACLRTC